MIEFIEWFNTSIKLVEWFGSFHFLIVSMFMFFWGFITAAYVIKR